MARDVAPADETGYEVVPMTTEGLGSSSLGMNATAADQTLVRESSPEPTSGSSAIAAALRGRTESWVLQLFRYGLTAVVALAVDFALFVALSRALGIHYLWANVVGFSAGLAANYALSTCWVFSSRRHRNRLVEFAVFAGVGVAGLGVNQLVIWGAVERWGQAPELGKIAATVVVFFWNFGLRKWLAFSGAKASTVACPSGAAAIEP